jgi:restriction endonuclease Mrr
MERAQEIRNEFLLLRNNPNWLRAFYEELHAVQLGNMWREYIEPTARSEMNRRIGHALALWIRESTLTRLKASEHDAILVDAFMSTELPGVREDDYVGEPVYHEVISCKNIDSFARVAERIVSHVLFRLEKLASRDAAHQLHAEALRGYWQAWQSRITPLTPKLIGSIHEVTHEMMVWLKAHSAAVNNVTWDALEHIIAEVFASHGFIVELTGRSRGKSADLIAIRTDEFGVDTKYLVEVKRYSKGNPVGLSIVNQVLGAAQRMNVQHAFLVTTSRFTEDVDLQRSKLAELHLHLRDGEQVREWLTNYRAHDGSGLWLDPRWSTIDRDLNTG